MGALDRLIPNPRLVQVDQVDVAAPPETAWQAVRHGNLGETRLTRALFTLRTLPSRLAGHRREPLMLRLDDFARAEGPGFRLLVDDPPQEAAVGAIGRVFQADIPFRDVRTPEAFAAFDEPGEVKVAWALRVTPWGDRDARIALELRVTATDDDAWRRFRRYFRRIGPFSHFLRRSLLAQLARKLGDPLALERIRSLPGDDLLPDAAGSLTHGITLRAPPEAVWPWLVQMGGDRAGWYSWDRLDNAGRPSATEILSELQDLKIGDILPGLPGEKTGFEVLRMEPPRVLVLGGLFDSEDDAQLPFHAARPRRYWHVTWAFALEPLDAGTTRLHVRARAAFPRSGRLHVAWVRPVHHMMQTRQLRNLKVRVNRP